MDSRSRELEEDYWRISVLEQIRSFSSWEFVFFSSPRRLSCQQLNKPINIYRSSEVEKAFRVPQSGQSRGKTVIEMCDDVVPMVHSPSQPVNSAKMPATLWLEV